MCYARFLTQNYSQSEVKLVPKPCSAFFLFLPSISNYENQDDLCGHRNQGEIVVASVRRCESRLGAEMLNLSKRLKENSICEITGTI